MENNKIKKWNWAPAGLLLTVSSITLPSIWPSYAPTSSDKSSQKVTAAQNQSTLLETLSPAVQQEVKEIDKVTTAAATELDDNIFEEALASDLEPCERLTNTLDTIREKINADAQELLDPAFGKNEDCFDIRHEMLSALNEDPLLLDTLLELFEQDPDSLLGRELAAVLTIIDSSKGQTIALDMATNDSLYTNEERMASLMIIAEMDSITS